MPSLPCPNQPVSPPTQLCRFWKGLAFFNYRRFIMWFSSHVIVSTTASFCLARGAYASLIIGRSDIYAIFANAKWSANTTVSYPGSECFNASTERWSVFDPPTFSAAISPATERDVVKAVKLATRHSIPFLATGGRHGYTTTLEALRDGLAIDLSQFNTVSIDKSAAAMTIGGAVRFRDIYDPVFEAGFEIQTGTCSCPGMVGVTLGGGVGPWGGVHGLIIDALLSLRVVTASGLVVEVSNTSNPDLFWAFRGAGANFGIVISATYQLQRQVNGGQILTADFIITADRIGPYFDLLDTYNNGNLPKLLSITSIMSYNATADVPQISATWAYLGPEDEGLKAFAPIFALNPIVTGVQTFPWNKVIEGVAGGADAFNCLNGAEHSVYDVNGRKISGDTYKMVFDKLSVFYEQNPDGRESLVQIDLFPNQAMLATPDDATAYPWRDTIALHDIEFILDPGNTTLKDVTNSLALQLRSDIVATSGYPDLATYINSAHGDETLEQKYGAEKVPRLIALKKIWDPKSVFSFNNAIPTEYERHF
ncbi:hypothetical protein G7Y89_g10162 [Cudoniella acicularis]|uniref:FAD-binding PCMH-type domain-containing protein n=1 Tax=Cudoniella acicularis TaxID=354080 RepID=A0A8H4RDA4_9HELO|nr:hypothetical protein G7Y89_g10162 [Cudoniella acicularis]